MIPQNYQHQEDRIKALEDGQKAIFDLLKPISDTYRTVSSLGKWFTATAVFISIIIGIVIGLRSILSK